ARSALCYLPLLLMLPLVGGCEGCSPTPPAGDGGVVIREDCGPDRDGDGICDEQEVELGTDPDGADSDGDGIDDADEIRGGTDPSNPDSDGDGIPDGDE